MEIIINSKSKELPEQERITVQHLLQLEIPGRQQGIAVAINNQVVAKASWEQTYVHDKDHVVIIRATQGG